MEHGKSQAKLHLWWAWYLEFNYINFMYMYSISSYSQNWFRNSRLHQMCIIIIYLYQTTCVKVAVTAALE